MLFRSDGVDWLKRRKEAPLSCKLGLWKVPQGKLPKLREGKASAKVTKDDRKAAPHGTRDPVLDKIGGSGSLD